MIQRNQIWKLYGTKYLEMTKRLLEETDLSALIGDRKKRIGIKPNLVVPSPAEFGGTTHPEVVAGIVEYLQENRFEDYRAPWSASRSVSLFSIRRRKRSVSAPAVC